MPVFCAQISWSIVALIAYHLRQHHWIIPMDIAKWKRYIKCPSSQLTGTHWKVGSSKQRFLQMAMAAKREAGYLEKRHPSTRKGQASSPSQQLSHGRGDGLSPVIPWGGPWTSFFPLVSMPPPPQSSQGVVLASLPPSLLGFIEWLSYTVNERGRGLEPVEIQGVQKLWGFSGIKVLEISWQPTKYKAY